LSINPEEFAARELDALRQLDAKYKRKLEGLPDSDEEEKQLDPPVFTYIPTKHQMDSLVKNAIEVTRLRGE
jgi:hypothetical protein